MIAEYLKMLDGSDTLGVVSLVVAIVVFVSIVWKTLHIPPAHLRMMEQLPLDTPHDLPAQPDEDTP